MDKTLRSLLVGVVVVAAVYLWGMSQRCAGRQEARDVAALDSARHDRAVAESLEVGRQRGRQEAEQRIAMLDASRATAERAASRLSRQADSLATALRGMVPENLQKVVVTVQQSYDALVAEKDSIITVQGETIRLLRGELVRADSAVQGFRAAATRSLDLAERFRKQRGVRRCGPLFGLGVGLERRADLFVGVGCRL